MTNRLLPTGWGWISIADLVALEEGAITDGPFGSNLKTTHYRDHGPRVIRLQNIAECQFVDERAHISHEHFRRLRKHEVQEEDVLIAILGEDLPRACIAPANLGPAVVKADCLRFRVNDCLIRPRYAMYALNSHQVRCQAKEKVHGVGRPRLRLREVKELELPVAPLNEQIRVVSAIDSIYSRLDDAAASLEHARETLDRYRASVLKAAVEGRLVPTEAELARQEGRDYEPASVLLERILAERRRRWEETEQEKLKAKGKPQKDDRWKKKYTGPAAPDTSGLPALPEGWCWASVDQLVAYGPNSIVDGPFGSNLKTAHYTVSGPRVIRLQNIGEGRFFDEKAHISETHFQRLFKHQVRGGDVVVASLGDTVPRACCVPESLGPAIVKADCIRLTVNHDAVEPKFLMFALNSEVVRQHAGQRVHGVGRPRLGLRNLRELPIPLPPREAQDSLVRLIEKHWSIADETETTVTVQRGRIDHLRRAVLRLAFQGRLVDQDPNEEPASALVERIRTGRTTKESKDRMGERRGKKVNAA